MRYGTEVKVTTEIAVNMDPFFDGLPAGVPFTGVSGSNQS